MTYYGYPENLEEYKKAIEQPSMYDAFTIEALKAHIFDQNIQSLLRRQDLETAQCFRLLT